MENGGVVTGVNGENRGGNEAKGFLERLSKLTINCGPHSLIEG